MAQVLLLHITSKYVLFTAVIKNGVPGLDFTIQGVKNQLLDVPKNAKFATFHKTSAQKRKTKKPQKT